MTGPQLKLRPGTVYRARVRIDAPKLLATEGAIRARFEDLGFTDVVVWKSADDLPADWPADERSGPSSFSSWTAFAQGKWPKPEQLVTRPEPLIAFWIYKGAGPLSDAGPDTPGSHAWARRQLSDAWAAAFGAAPDRATAQAIGAIAWIETRYTIGWDLEGVGSNNWGAIQCAGAKSGACDQVDALTCPENCFRHIDHHADGSCYLACFRRYASPEDGAKDFIAELVTRRPKVRAVIGSGSATRIANAMHDSKYFELSPELYADRIVTGARAIASSLGEPLLLSTRSWVAGLLSLGAVAGVVGFCYRKGYMHVL